MPLGRGAIDTVSGERYPDTLHHAQTLGGGHQGDFFSSQHRVSLRQPRLLLKLVFWQRRTGFAAILS